MRHYNVGIMKALSDLFKIKGESLPMDVAEVITPVVVVQRESNELYTQTLFNNVSATLLTTPTDRDYYLTAAVMSRSKDSTSTNTVSTIQITVNGVQMYPLILSDLDRPALPAHTQMYLRFPTPIKIDRNTSIVVTNNTNTANVRTCATIFGYFGD